MDDFAKLPSKDRDDLFQNVASQRRMLSAIIEKDFWVCWTLKRLFTLPHPPGSLLFKGGTSLSKVFQAIERFSEDVDLSFDRHSLGFVGDKDPSTQTGKSRQRSLKALKEFCQEIIREKFLPQIIEAFSESLGAGPSAQWNVEMATDDPDGQTILFHYPTSKERRPGDASYIPPAVRLELGARSDHWPAQEGTVTPYVAEAYPQFFKNPKAHVHVLSVERTFWEKATLLHSWYHAPLTKQLRDRQSRHYYDLVQLYQRGLATGAMADKDLLLKVAKHKDVFFGSAWAKYGEARPGTLRLVPPVERLPELQRDYAQMQEMIFGIVPAFDNLLATLEEMESQINGNK